MVSCTICQVVRDLFTPVVPLEQTHHLFRRVREGPGRAAARRMMNEVFAEFSDVDKSFMREFQTGGFSARVFELALFAYLREQGLVLDRSQPAPDFVIRGDAPVAIEVTTTNPAQDDEPDDLVYSPPSPEKMSTMDRDFVFQLGKALRRKILHRDAAGRAYWEKPHITGMPFVIAVGAFHHQHAQMHRMGLVGEYLYGQRVGFDRDATGKLRITSEKILEHEAAGKTLPSGLFGQPEASNVAGVLFSNAHTVSIFNRIGAERGYGSPGAAMCRFGTAYDPDPNASEARFFAYVVGDRPPGQQETFAEGMELFINPWATTKLSPLALPAITYNELLDDGRVMSTFTDALQPYSSKTLIFEGDNADLFARYHQLLLLGLVPPLHSDEA